MLVYDHWEQKRGSMTVSGISGETVRKINCVEILLNSQLFHIDIDSDVLRKLPRLRQIIDHPDELLEILKAYEDRCIRISLQSPADENGECVIVLVQRIILTKNSENNQYSFIDKNGLTHIHSIVRNPRVIIGEISVIWGA